MEKSEADGNLEGKWRDTHSTGHKVARKIKLTWMAQNDEPYACESCGRGPVEMPYSQDLAEVYAKLELPVPEKRSPPGQPGNRLEVNHEDKNVNNFDLDNLSLLCVPCHKERDTKTAVGVSRLQDPWGYGQARLRELLQYEDDPNFVEDEA